MKCLKCQAELPGGAKFCKECGNKMESTCPQCGKTIPSDSKFCIECGHDLRKHKESKTLDFDIPRSYTPKHLADKILTTRSFIEGERKIVTVMFADVANSTAMFGKLDPETVHDIMDRCFRLLMDEVHKYEGTINQFLGDGLMALFGAPIAHEDHAQRACHAALSMKKALTPFGESLKDRYGIDFKMRIGLNSGPVVVGTVGDDLRMDYTAKGDPVNLAARMESSAEPGVILVSKNLRKQVKEFFEFESIGKIQVKGKEEPVEAYQLIRPTEITTRIAASVAKGGLTRFVGRNHEVEVLAEAFEKARSGDGQVVGIVGEAGVGKSRLLLEFRNILPKEEFSYFEGRCIHYGGSMAYLPILDVLRSFVGIEGGEQELIIKRKLQERVLGLDENFKHVIPSFQELLSLTVDDEAYVSLEPNQKKEKTFESIRDLLVNISRLRPLVLAVEDLHWIDNTTEELLSYLIGLLPKTRILLLLLYRPEYTHQWGSKSYYSKIGVGQLSASTCTELIGSILQEGEVAPELRGLILGKTSGNPLYLEELTHSLVESGSIQKQGDQFVLVRDASSLDVPDTVQGIIAARMDRLDESLKRIMQVAAVIGREFAFRILEIIAEVKEDVKSGLINLQGLEFIYEKSLYPELEYIFKHALTQEVAYNSLLLKRRKEIHEQIGRAIENLYLDRLKEFYEMLAYHFSKSNNKIKAYKYLKLSARKATEREALWEAFRWYKDAVDTLGLLPDTQQNKEELVRLLLMMMVPMRALGYPEDSSNYIELSEKIAQNVDDPGTSAKVTSFIGLYHVTKGDAGIGLVYIENTFGEAEKSGTLDLIAPTGFDLGLAYLSRRAWKMLPETGDRILPFIEQARREKEFFGRPPNPYASITMFKGLAMATMGDFLGGEPLVAAAVSFATEINHLFTIGHMEFGYMWLCATKGDGQACVNHGETAVRLMKQVRAMIWRGQAYTGVGYGYYLLGNPDEAVIRIEKGIEAQNKVGTLMWKACHYLYLSEIYFDMGDTVKATQNADEALLWAQKTNAKDHEGLSRIILGRLEAMKGKSHLDAAEKSILDGIQILKGQSLKPDLSVGYLHVGELYAESGRREEALVNLKKAVGMFRDMGMDYWLGKAQNALAKL